MKKALIRVDGWSNPITSLGTSRDAMRHNTLTDRTRLDDATLERLYRLDDLAARIVDILPEQALRQGFQVSFPDNPELEYDVNKELERLHLEDKLFSLAKNARLYGGSGLLCVPKILGGLAAPFDEEGAQDLSRLHVIPRKDFTALSYAVDIRDPRFGLPDIWRINLEGSLMPTLKNQDPKKRLKQFRQTLEIHHSHFTYLHGDIVSQTDMLRYQGWGQSVLERVYELLTWWGVSWQTIPSALSRYSQAVYKVKDLMQMYAGDTANLFKARMSLIDQARSMINAIVLDADGEDFEVQAPGLSGMADLFDKLMLRVSQATGIPATLLMGQSPAGLNATGESDLRNWYDKVDAYRVQSLNPVIERVVRIYLHANDFGDEKGNFEIIWPPLMKINELDAATSEKMKAEAMGVYIQNGVLSADEVALQFNDLYEHLTDEQIQRRHERIKQGVDVQPSDPGDTPGLSTEEEGATIE